MVWEAHRLGGTTSGLSSYDLGGASLGRHIAWEALLMAYQAMIWEAHRLGGTTLWLIKL